MIKRIIQHANRLRNARRFGVNFRRRAGFVAPEYVRIGGRKVPLTVPHDSREEKFTLVFVENFLDDQYALRNIGGPLSTIVDIGANIGFFTVSARSYFPHAQIHAYEPNPRIVSYLKQNAAQVCAMAFPEAVGAREGRVTMIDDGYSGNARTKDVGLLSEGISQVPLETIVKRLGGSVDLMKMDCEGAEWQILQDRATMQHVRYLAMEFHLWAEYTLEQLKAQLTLIGFHIDRCEMAGDGFGLLTASLIKS